MKPLGIHHVNVTVGELESARAFYVGALGMTERTDRPNFAFEGAWLDLGGQQVHLVVGTPSAETGDHFAIAVEDLTSAVSELREAGVKVGEPRDVGRGRQAFLRDPWGNLIELQQPG